MEKGKYDRKGKLGLSKLQDEILAILDESDNPNTIIELMTNLNQEKTPSKRVVFTRTMERMRTRGLVKTIGRNDSRENLWVKV